MIAIAIQGCAGKVDKGAPEGAGNGSQNGQMDAGPNAFANANRDTAFKNVPDAAAANTSITPDAYFFEDPPPPYCGPDGGAPPDPTGTLECPSDKNRQGCPCTEKNAVEACWPGKRANRNHGICMDGTTTCHDEGEFGLRWGPCEGYVLPDETALTGPDACSCFSSGRWSLSNLSPCIYESNGRTYLYAALINPDGTLNCGGPFGMDEIPPAPSEPWADNSLTVDCAGQFKLCFTIKAGDFHNPQPTDCQIMQTCVETWYGEEGVPQDLPPLPGWNTTTLEESNCSAEFVRVGGYGEMTVLGTSIECDEVDDGSGQPFVFYRTNYCAPSCQDPANANAPECAGCVTGGSGSF